MWQVEDGGLEPENRRELLDRFAEAGAASESGFLSRYREKVSNLGNLEATSLQAGQVCGGAWHYLRIDHDGSAYGAPCSKIHYAGRIWQDTFEAAPEVINCETQECAACGLAVRFDDPAKARKWTESLAPRARHIPASDSLPERERPFSAQLERIAPVLQEIAASCLPVSEDELEDAYGALGDSLSKSIFLGLMKNFAEQRPFSQNISNATNEWRLQLALNESLYGGGSRYCTLIAPAHNIDTGNLSEFSRAIQHHHPKLLFRIAPQARDLAGVLCSMHREHKEYDYHLDLGNNAINLYGVPTRSENHGRRTSIPATADSPLLLSVIIAADNITAARRSIDSGLLQAGEPMEILVIPCGDAAREEGPFAFYRLNYPDIVRVWEIPHKSREELLNIALDSALGAYVLFLEAGDCLNKDAVKKLAAIVQSEKPDILWFGATDGLANTPATCRGLDALPVFLGGTQGLPALSNILCSRQLLQEYNIRHTGAATFATLLSAFFHAGKVRTYSESFCSHWLPQPDISPTIGLRDLLAECDFLKKFLPRLGEPADRAISHALNEHIERRIRSLGICDIEASRPVNWQELKKLGHHPGILAQLASIYAELYCGTEDIELLPAWRKAEDNHFHILAEGYPPSEPTLITAIYAMEGSAPDAVTFLAQIHALVQTGVEILVVVDGLGDAAEIALKNLAESKRAFRIIYSTERAGLGLCLNVALKAARGEYILFLDAEREYTEKYFQEACKSLQTAAPEILLDSSKLLENPEQPRRSLPSGWTDREFVRELFLQGLLGLNPASFIIKSRLIRSQNCEFKAASAIPGIHFILSVLEHTERAFISPLGPQIPLAVPAQIIRDFPSSAYLILFQALQEAYSQNSRYGNPGWASSGLIGLAVQQLFLPWLESRRRAGQSLPPLEPFWAELARMTFVAGMVVTSFAEFNASYQEHICTARESAQPEAPSDPMLSLVIYANRIDENLTRFARALAGQSFRDWEAFFIVDLLPGGAEPCLAKEAPWDDPRFSLLKNGRSTVQTLAAAVNSGKGKFIGCLDPAVNPDSDYLLHLLPIFILKDRVDFVQAIPAPGGAHSGLLMRYIDREAIVRFYCGNEFSLKVLANKIFRKELFEVQDKCDNINSISSFFLQVLLRAKGGTLCPCPCSKRSAAPLKIGESLTAYERYFNECREISSILAGFENNITARTILRKLISEKFQLIRDGFYRTIVRSPRPAGWSLPGSIVENIVASPDLLSCLLADCAKLWAQDADMSPIEAYPVPKTGQKPDFRLLPLLESDFGTRQPVISLILSARNEESQLRQTLASLTPQLQDGIELILVDNCSTLDDTYPVCNALASISQNVGFYRTEWPLPVGEIFNQALQTAKGQYVWFLTAGTRLEPGFLNGIMTTLEKDPAEVCATGYYKSLENGRIINRLQPGYVNNSEMASFLANTPGLELEALIFQTGFLRDHSLKFLEKAFNFYPFILASLLQAGSLLCLHSTGATIIERREILSDPATPDCATFLEEARQAGKALAPLRPGSARAAVIAAEKICDTSKAEVQSFLRMWLNSPVRPAVVKTFRNTVKSFPEILSALLINAARLYCREMSTIHETYTIRN